MSNDMDESVIPLSKNKNNDYKHFTANKLLGIRQVGRSTSTCIAFARFKKCRQ